MIPAFHSIPSIRGIQGARTVGVVINDTPQEIRKLFSRFEHPAYLCSMEENVLEQTQGFEGLLLH
jgi:hypothetical protein